MNLRKMFRRKPKRLTKGDAARNLLRWNLKGQATGAIARRGIYIRQHEEDSNCYACKIGLVMLGRWGEAASVLNSSGGYRGYSEDGSKVREIKRYGPMVVCPAFEWGCLGGGTKLQLGALIEHLFEYHRWSVMRIDKWLAELAETDLERERKRAGLT